MSLPTKDHSTNSEEAQKKFDLLLLWLEQHHIWYDKDLLELNFKVTDKLGHKAKTRNFNLEEPSLALNEAIVTSGLDCGVIAKKDLEVDTLVCTIPKQSILSWRTGTISNIFDDESIHGKFAMCWTLVYELSQKAKSPWYGYLQSLPEYEPLPLYWSESELKYLEGTQVVSELEKNKREVTEAYNKHGLLLLEKYPDIFDKDVFTLDALFKASSLVASRAFRLNGYHDDAMIPLADLFNHKSGGEHIHLQFDDETCDECGNPDYCIHKMEALGMKTNEPVSDTGSMGELVSSLSFEHDSDEESQEDEEALLKEEKFDTKQKHDPDEVIDLRIVLPCNSGEEVFNTYGQHSNAFLLFNYGFCELDNPSNKIEFDTDTVLDQCSGAFDLMETELASRFELFESFVEIFAEREEKIRAMEAEIESEEDLSDEEREEFVLEGEEDEEEEYDENDEHDHSHHGHVHSEHCSHGHPEDGDEHDESEAGSNDLLHLDQSGQCSHPLIMLLHVMAMRSELLKSLIGDELPDVDQTILNYFDTVLEQWHSATDLSKSHSHSPSLSPLSDSKRQKLEDGSFASTQGNGTTEDLEIDELDGIIPDEEWIPSVAEVLQRLCEARLAQYLPITTIPQDLKTLHSSTNSRHTFATICRLTEKIILSKCLDSLPV